MADRYVAASGGVASGAGGIGAPWTLAYAAAGAGGTLAPGDVVYCRAGTYGAGLATVIDFTCNGASGNPIIFTNYPGEFVQWNLRLTTGGGSFIRFIGTKVDFDIGLTTDTGDIANQQGINSAGEGCEFINLSVHDYGGDCMGVWADGPNQLVDGCIIYNAGRMNDVGGAGFAYNIYTQNISPSVHNFRRIIQFHSFGYGVHAYTEASSLDNLHFDRMTAFRNGRGAGLDLFVGGDTDVVGFQFKNGTIWGEDHNADCAHIGMQGTAATNVDAEVSDSRIHGAVKFHRFTNPTFRRNMVRVTGSPCLWVKDPTVFWDASAPADYAPYDIDENDYRRGSGSDTHRRVSPDGDSIAEALAAWQGATGQDAASTFSTSALTAHARVDPSPYEEGRAHITVENPAGAGTVAVDVSSALAVGDQFEVRHVFDLRGTPVLTGTYAGGTIAVPMANKVPPAPPGGWPTGRDPGSYGLLFSAFVLLKTGEAGGGPVPAKVGVIDVLSTWLLGSTNDIMVGFDPDFVLLFDMGAALDVNNAGLHSCIGVFSATQQGLALSRSIDGVTPSDVGSALRNDRVHMVSTTGTSSAGRLTGSMVSGGFRLTVGEVYAANRKVGYLALAGAAPGNVAMGSGVTKSDNTDYVVSGLGFTPKAVLFLSGSVAQSVNVTTGSNGSSAVGVLVGAAAACVGISVQDAMAAENAAATHSETHAIFASSSSGGGAITAPHLPGQIDADGFTLTHPTGSSQIPFLWLAFDGLEAALLTGATRTDLGTLTSGPLGFTPNAAFGFSSMNATAAQTTASNDAQRAIGVAASDGSMACAFTLAADGLNPTDSVLRSSATRFLQHFDRTGADTFALAGDLDVQAFNADEVVFEQLDADTAAHRFAVLVLGTPSGGGPDYQDVAVTFTPAAAGGGGSGPDFLVGGGLVQV